MSTKYIIFHGNLQTGFTAHGPFESVHTTTSDDDGMLVEDAAEVLERWVDDASSIHVVPLHPAREVEETAARISIERERFGIFNGKNSI